MKASLPLFQKFAEVLHSVFLLYRPMLGDVRKLLWGILQPADFAPLTEQAHWGPEDDPPHQGVAAIHHPPQLWKNQGLG